MPESIIAVVPATSDVETVQENLTLDGVETQFINSLEEALHLLSRGSTPVFFCDSDNQSAWRSPMLQMLRSGRASRVVLLSTLAQEHSFASSAAYSTAITV
jgi:DNA-binding NtrC family response regulator